TNPFSLIPEIRELHTKATLAEAGTVRRFFAKIFLGQSRLDRTATALEQLVALLDSDRAKIQYILAEQLDAPLDQVPVWTDFLARPADYYVYLSKLGVQEADGSASSGRLPAHIVDAVRQQPLDASLLEVHLRGYQSFGARYALVQRRTLLGDEMGLGKTIQALAALAHLTANHGRGFVVICPAGVVANWHNEIRRKSRLKSVMISGNKTERSHVFHEWMENGGIGIMSYETARAMHQQIGFTSLKLC